jgi:hypothetical protein
MSRIYEITGNGTTKTTAADGELNIKLIIPDGITGPQTMMALERLKRDVLRGEK